MPTRFRRSTNMTSKLIVFCALLSICALGEQLPSVPILDLLGANALESFPPNNVVKAQEASALAVEAVKTAKISVLPVLPITEP